MTHPIRKPVAADVLHDLNQSLALVAGYVELAEEALLGGDPASAKARLTLAVHAAQYAQAAVHSPALDELTLTAHQPKRIQPTPARVGCFQSSAASRSRRRRPSRQLRVLVVEDSSTLRHMFTIVLERVGYSVQAVALGSEALSLLQDASFDVIISDLSLGNGLSGLDLADAVQQVAPAVRFILATGSIEEISPEDCAQFGVDAVLTKPFSPSQLRSAIANVSA